MRLIRTQSATMRVDAPQKHRGAWAELAACQWLLSRGYEVFLNISSHGPADLVAFQGEQILKIDVKSGDVRGVKARPNQGGITFLYASDDGECVLMEPPSPRVANANCGHCNKEFSKTTPWKKFCSNHCRKMNFLKQRGVSCI